MIMQNHDNASQRWDTEPDRYDSPPPAYIDSEHEARPCKCSRKGRNLVVCIDGTLNEFGPKNTNVIALHGDLVKDKDQIAFYSSGIGASIQPPWRSPSILKQFVDPKLDSAFACNIEKIVINAYCWLADHHNEGDQIFLFGFSRGAYQVRILSAMIHKVGLIPKCDEEGAWRAYKFYVDSSPDGSEPGGAREFKERFSSKEAQVHFVGAWDTVSSVGVGRGRVHPGTTEGMQHVCFFRHALALDELRVNFLPEYAWGGVSRPDGLGGTNDTLSNSASPHTKEVWFAGRHSDVGGGSKNKDLSIFPLRWMSREAQHAGLRSQASGHVAITERLRFVNESLAWSWKVCEYLPFQRLRYGNMDSTTYSWHRAAGRQIQPDQKIHASVIILSDSYTPQAVLPINSPPLKGWKDLMPSSNEASWSCPFEDWSPWVELDLYHISRAIIKAFESLPKDASLVSRQLKHLLAFDEGIKSLCEVPEAIDSLSFAWENLCETELAFKTAQDAIRTALKKMGKIVDIAGRYAAQLSGVTSIAISPDGKLTVSGSMDGTLKIWNTSSSRCLRGHSAPIASVAFSPDGKRIASGSWDHTITIWDAFTGAMIGEPYTGHKHRVTCVTFVPDSKCVASASVDRTVRLWDTEKGEAVWVIEQPALIHSVTSSPDGQRVVGASLDRTVRVWDAATGDPIGQPFVGHTGSVTCAAFSPLENRVVSGSEDKEIRVWDLVTGQSSKPFLGHGGAVTSVAFSRDGKHIVSGSVDQTIRIWETDSGVAVGFPFTGHTGSITSVIFSPDERHIISSSLDGSIKWWRVSPFVGHRGSIHSIAFSPDSKRVVTGSEDMTIRIWEAETGEAVGKPFEGHTSPVLSVAYSPCQEHIVSGSGSIDASVRGDRTVRIWNVETGELVGKPLKGHKDAVNSVAFSPDGECVASGSGDSTIRLWNAKSGEALGKVLKGHQSGVFSVAYSLNGKRLLSASWDGSVLAWDDVGAETNTEFGRPLCGRVSQVSAIAYSPDGMRVAFGSENGVVQLWDTETGGTIGKPLEGHRLPVTYVTFSPNGTRMVSGSEDQTIQEWDAVTGGLIGKPMESRGGEILSIAISPDGKQMVSGSQTGHIEVWDVVESEGSLSTGWQRRSFCVRTIDTR